MSALSEISSLVISTATVGITRAGFGIPLIVSHNASFPERVRFYSGISDVGNDFATTSPEYLAADAILSQSPHPEQLCIGRAANKPTQQYTIGESAVRNSDTTSYQINVIGQGVTPTTAIYNSDSTATAQEIHNGLVTALNAVTGANYVAALAPLPTFTAIPFTVLSQPAGTLTATGHGLNTGDGPIQLTTSGTLPTGLAVSTNYYVIRIDANTIALATSLANALAGTAIVLSSNGTGTNDVTHVAGTLSPILPFLVTGTAAGNWFSLEVVDPTALSNKESHADPGIAADLNAMLLENSDWYAFTTLYNSQALVLAAAAWVETQSLIYLADVPETLACKSSGGTGGTADTLDNLHTLARERTAGSYHPSPANMLSAAWLGRMLPIDPGDDNWKFKTLSGVATTKVTDTDRINLRARSANFYQFVAGVGITCDGTVASGDFIDNTRGDDWVNDDMNKAVFGVLVAVNKVPMEDAGAALVEAEIRGSLGRAVDMGIYAASPKPVVNVPKVSSISTTNRAQRLLPNITWSATRAGAVNRVQTTGVVSV